MKSKQLNEELSIKELLDLNKCNATNLDIPNNNIIGSFIPYLYAKGIMEEIEKRTTTSIQSAVIKEIDKIDEYLLMTNKGEYGISKKELKQNLNKNVFENGNKIQEKGRED